MSNCQVCSLSAQCRGPLCLECLALVQLMLAMRSFTAPVVVQTTKKKPLAHRVKTTTPPGMTVEKMLTRIQTHPDFERMPWRVRENTQRVARFDHRRNRVDNDFVRELYWHLTVRGV